MPDETRSWELSRHNEPDGRNQDQPLVPLDRLLLWYDPRPRPGAEAMAVDEALLELSDISVLRIYQWALPTVTYGYFDKKGTASVMFPSDHLEYIRRWTGGGIVDHREDIPFTLALIQPKGRERPKSSMLYRWIHGALARVLRECGVDCHMLSEDAPNGGRSCFSSPVTSDLVASSGEKTAGGGQRRTRKGVLHQGSIQNCRLPMNWADDYARRLSNAYVISHEEEPLPGLIARANELVLSKYGRSDWNH